jgi:hypothetical protein
MGQAPNAGPLDHSAAGYSAQEQPAGPSVVELPSHLEPKWSWSCRALDPRRRWQLLREDVGAPRVGDVALVQVGAVGHHSRLATVEGEKLRLYPDDVLVAVFGNRYATHAFEGEVRSTDDLHLLTDAGMIGTVRSRHQDTKLPTRLRFLGYLADEAGQRLNLKALRFRPAASDCALHNILLVVGTAMNSGKTTTAAKLVKALLHKGLRVAACKLTGSVCPRDRGEFSATGAHDARDFSDYGFPSTYLASEDELLGLFETMLADVARSRPDVVVMEIADGVLQRETSLLLGHEAIRHRAAGIVLAAACAPSALFGVAQIEAQGHRVLAVSGCLTSSPLFMREFAASSPVPIASSAGDGDDLAELVLRHFRILS